MISKKVKDRCIIEKKRIGKRLTFKCKNLDRVPTAEELVDSIKTRKIIVK